ncbi:MAG: hypothetical protein K2G23_07125, partial [Muribaculaceae bacterium]|nr:hypothetical protein [Muribaculaceae bacterium]
MACKTKENAEILKNWLLTVPPIDKDFVFSKIYAECLISPTTLRNWRYGRCRIPMSGLRDLNKVALEYSGHELYF